MSPVIRGHVSRDALPVVDHLLYEEPAILLEGPRGSGKSTLVREIAVARDARIVDLDDEAVVGFIQQDPTTALTYSGLVVVDEFQRVPAVLSVVKRIVDRSSDPGRFLLAGSVSARLLPTGAETLTGRVHRMLLPPLSAAEIVGGDTRLLPALLKDEDPTPIASSWRRPDYFEFLAAGGYPAALARPTGNSRRRWFASYLGSVAERDLPQVADIRHPGALPRLYRLIAQQTSTVIGRTALGEQLGLAPATARAYLDLLAHVHLVRELPGWTVGISAKAARRPKIHVTDTGLAAAAIAADGHRLASGQLAGLFLESYVVTELMKQANLIDEPLTLGHFRDRAGVEVDIIIERPDGRVIAIEVKSATTTNQADARGLRFLSDRLGDRMQAGLLLHTGPLTARVSERIWATPVSALWGGTAPADMALPGNDANRI
jgi:uncharacterized protein